MASMQSDVEKLYQANLEDRNLEIAPRFESYELPQPYEELAEAGSFGQDCNDMWHDMDNWSSRNFFVSSAIGDSKFNCHKLCSQDANLDEKVSGKESNNSASDIYYHMSASTTASTSCSQQHTISPFGSVMFDSELSPNYTQAFQQTAAPTRPFSAPVVANKSSQQYHHRLFSEGSFNFQQSAACYNPSMKSNSGVYYPNNEYSMLAEGRGTSNQGGYGAIQNNSLSLDQNFALNQNYSEQSFGFSNQIGGARAELQQTQTSAYRTLVPTANEIEATMRPILSAVGSTMSTLTPISRMDMRPSISHPVEPTISPIRLRARRSRGSLVRGGIDMDNDNLINPRRIFHPSRIGPNGQSVEINMSPSDLITQCIQVIQSAVSYSEAREYMAFCDISMRLSEPTESKGIPAQFAPQSATATVVDTNQRLQLEQVISQWVPYRPRNNDNFFKMLDRRGVTFYLEELREAIDIIMSRPPRRSEY